MALAYQDIAYLRAGNPRQQAAWAALDELGVMHHLAAYDPVLIGTIPIDIDVTDSDLDRVL